MSQGEGKLRFNSSLKCCTHTWLLRLVSHDVHPGRHLCFKVTHFWFGTGEKKYFQSVPFYVTIALNCQMYAVSQYKSWLFVQRIRFSMLPNGVRAAYVMPIRHVWQTHKHIHTRTRLASFCRKSSSIRTWVENETSNFLTSLSFRILRHSIFFSFFFFWSMILMSLAVVIIT